jgi:hypothetical protein
VTLLLTVLIANLLNLFLLQTHQEVIKWGNFRKNKRALNTFDKIKISFMKNLKKNKFYFVDLIR